MKTQMYREIDTITLDLPPFFNFQLFQKVIYLYFSTALFANTVCHRGYRRSAQLKLLRKAARLQRHKRPRKGRGVQRKQGAIH